MIRVLGIAILVVVFNESVGQADSIRYKFIEPKTRIQYLILNEGKMISQLNPRLIPFDERQIRKKLMQINNVPVDSSGFESESFPRLVGSHFVTISRETRQFSEISEKGLRTIPVNNIANYSIASTVSNFFVVQNTGKIYLLNEKLGAELIADLSEAICILAPCQGYDVTETVNHIFELNDTTLFVRTCLWEFGCQYANYYLVDRITRNVRKVTDIIKKHVDVNCWNTEETEIWLSSMNGMYYRVLKEKTSSECDEIMEMGDYVMDLEFNLVSKLLFMGKIEVVNNYYHPEIAGISVNNYGKIDLYYLVSRLDALSGSVLVPYQFIPQLEINMYKAFNDTALSQQDLEGLGKYELGILRNLIFAKHNYSFESEFYQAYFNLYCFYNTKEMREARNKDVNGMLTAADKENIQLITHTENSLR